MNTPQEILRTAMDKGKKERIFKSTVLSKLSDYWIETEFLLLAETGAMSVILLLFLLFVKKCFPEADIFDLLSAVIDNPSIIAVAAVFFIVGFIIITPLYYGIKWCYFQIAKGKTAPVSGAFFGYLEIHRWFKALVLSAVISLRKLVIYLPFGIMSAVGVFIASELIANTDSRVTETFIHMGTAVLLICAYVIFLLLTVKYEAVPFIYAENPDKNPFEILREGISLMDGSKAVYSAMIISYVPFMVLCILGFPIVILSPIFNMARAYTCARIIDKKLSVTDNENSAENSEKTERSEITA